MLRNCVHLRGVGNVSASFSLRLDNVTACCPPNRMDGESSVEMVGEKQNHSGNEKLLAAAATTHNANREQQLHQSIFVVVGGGGGFAGDLGNFQITHVCNTLGFRV